MITTTGEWIRWHAGLARSKADHGGMSVSTSLATSNIPDDELETAVADLLDAMTQFNFELNGRVPSESATVATVVPRSIAYAIAEISRMLKEAADVRSTSYASSAAWRLDTAWRAVLAGDVDNLRAHLADEEVMRDR